MHFFSLNSKFIGIAVLCLILSACVQLGDEGSINNNQTQITVYSNGHIITMNDKQLLAEAIAVKDGRILLVGDKQTVFKAAGKNSKKINLNGKTMLPGFIDAHGHLSMTIPFMALANVSSPPIGPVSNIADLQQVLKKQAALIKPGELVIGRGYDDSLLAEKRHPTRADLDAVSTKHPVIIIHVSGHLASCNSACLTLLGLDENSKDPKGGHIRRQLGSQVPNGVLEETAAYPVLHMLSVKDEPRFLALLEKASNYYASYGVTSIEDGAASVGQVKQLQRAAALGVLKQDVVSYVRFTDMGSLIGDMAPSKNYVNRFRVGGIKFMFDGSPQGKTAFLSQPYHIPPAGKGKDYVGYPILTKDSAQKLINACYAKDWQVYAHANGDAGAQHFIDTIAEAENKFGKKIRKPTMIHAQMVREDQLDQMAELGIIPSFFVSHTYFWGDWHRDSVMGEERASRISPVQSTVNRKMLYTLHNDAEVTPPDMLRLIWSAVNRKTRSGKVLGEEQRISVLNALKGVTSYAAYQHNDEAIKGSLEVGKQADFVLLDRNPLTVVADTLKDIKVLQTIKDGQTIYLRPSS